MKTLMALLVFLTGTALAVEDVNVRDLGAVGDGQTDDTAAFQKALDAAGEMGGGIVYAPAGHYRIDGTLRVPGGVTLRGSFEAPPTDQREARPKLDGTVLMAYAGRGNPESDPFIRLTGSMATVKGMIIVYPEWKQADVPPVPYPPTIMAEHVVNNAVIDLLLLNSYEGIHLAKAGRFLVRGVYGYPSYRGLYVDGCYDIGRVENCHFWPFGVLYKHDDPYCEWVNVNGVAFEFGRTDWQYVTNTFCFGYGVGYKFTETAAGGCNGNFLGIGADSTRRAVLVEGGQPWGILITNGEFVGRWGSADSVTVEIAPEAGDVKVSLTNCSFWGPIQQCVWARSPDAQFTANACHFVQFDNAGHGAPAIQLDAGKAIIQGSTFGEGATHVVVGERVRSAIVMGNQAEGGLVVENRAGSRTQLLANEAGGVAMEGEARLHYRVDVGSAGDSAFLKGWHHREAAGEWGTDAGTKRWGAAAPVVQLPVEPGRAYRVTLDVYVPGPIAGQGGGVKLGDQTLAAIPQEAGPALVTVDVPAGDADSVTLALDVPAWEPAKVIPGSADARVLSIGLRGIQVRATDGSPEEAFDANQR